MADLAYHMAIFQADGNDTQKYVHTQDTDVSMDDWLEKQIEIGYVLHSIVQKDRNRLLVTTVRNDMEAKRLEEEIQTNRT